MRGPLCPAEARPSAGCLFWSELVLSLILALAGAVGLLLISGQNFIWLPSVLCLVTALASLACLISLDRGLNFGVRGPVTIYALGRLLLALWSLALALGILYIIFGHVTGQNPVVTSSKVPPAMVLVPTLVLLLIHFFLGLYGVAKATMLGRKLATHPAAYTCPPGTLKRRTTLAQNGTTGQKTGNSAGYSNGRRPEELAMTNYSYVNSRPASRLDQLHYQPTPVIGDVPFKGSQNTVFTMASDV